MEHNWEGRLTIDDLKEMALEKNASAFVISTGNEEGKNGSTFSFAAFKKFDYQLTKEHCKAIHHDSPLRIFIHKK
jgi:hypothetical protein